ncbi:glycerophosphoinositol inositolphosphodiesterase GDPD2 [Pelomyxa schiedti]|nr:glycerophosphoinositol inositolphosphodiesterase GDPD2 [Pelomyxa schiedti]
MMHTFQDRIVVGVTAAAAVWSFVLLVVWAPQQNNNACNFSEWAYYNLHVVWEKGSERWVVWLCIVISYLVSMSWVLCRYPIFGLKPRRGKCVHLALVPKRDILRICLTIVHTIIVSAQLLLCGLCTYLTLSEKGLKHVVPLARRWILHVLPPLLSITFFIALVVLAFICAMWLSHRKTRASTRTILLVWIPLVYCYLLFSFYIAMLIASYHPCVGVILPPKPRIIAHRLGSDYGPENTMIALQGAMDDHVLSTETDFSISLDGIPFVIHDPFFKRTTTIADIFPERVNDPTSSFFIEDIAKLGTSKWSCGPKKSKSQISTSIPLLSDVLELTQKYNVTLIFDAYMPPATHPFFNTFEEILLYSLNTSSTDPSLIWWLTSPSKDTKNLSSVIKERTAFKLVYAVDADPLASWEDNFPTVARAKKLGYSIINAHFSVHDSELTTWHQGGLEVNIFVVNAPWLFSQMWCLGYDSVTSDNAHTLSRLERPILWLDPSSTRVLALAPMLLTLGITLALAAFFVCCGSRPRPAKN